MWSAIWIPDLSWPVMTSHDLPWPPMISPPHPNQGEIANLVAYPRICRSGNSRIYSRICRSGNKRFPIAPGEKLPATAQTVLDGLSTKKKPFLAHVECNLESNLRCNLGCNSECKLDFNFWCNLRWPCNLDVNCDAIWSPICDAIWGAIWSATWSLIFDAIWGAIWSSILSSILSWICDSPRLRERVPMSVQSLQPAVRLAVRIQKILTRYALKMSMLHAWNFPENVLR